MNESKRNFLAVPSISERRRALRLIKEALKEIQGPGGIRNVNDYETSRDFTWRRWTQSSKGKVETPASDFSVFKHETAKEVTILIQYNHQTGATWTEIPMLPLAIQFLRLWKLRIEQEDGDKLFNITDEKLRNDTIDTFTARQIRQSIMLFALTARESARRAVYDSLIGVINQAIRPHFKKHWSSLGKPQDFSLFPQLDTEISEFNKQSKTLRTRWLGKTHGGKRNVTGFADRPDFLSIIAFIDLVRPFWEYATEYFAKDDYEADCLQRIKLERCYDKLLHSIAVSDSLLKEIHERGAKTANGKRIPKRLQPLGFAIQHAIETFKIKEDRHSPHSTVRRHYDRMKLLEQEYLKSMRDHFKT